MGHTEYHLVQKNILQINTKKIVKAKNKQKLT